MFDSLGDVLPFAAGIALSPFPIIAVILVLGSKRAAITGTAFAATWVLGLAVLSTVLVSVMDASGIDDSTSDAAYGVSWGKLLIGLGFLGLAVKKWRSRPGPDDEPKLPDWMASTSEFGPAKAAGFGFVLSAANPKNLALSAAAAAAIVEQTDGSEPVIGAVVVFVIASSLTVIAPVVATLAAPAKAAPALASVRDFMTRYNSVIMMVVLVLLGLKMLGDGLKIL